MEKVLLEIGSPLEISVAVARTSQSPVPLPASVWNEQSTKRIENEIWKI